MIAVAWVGFQLLVGLGVDVSDAVEEGLDAVFARHRRTAEGVRRAVAAWELPLCAEDPEQYSDTVSAIVVPEGCDGSALVDHAAARYGVAFGAGLGDVAGRIFRIGHLGSLTEVMVLAGLGCAEMAMADFGIPVEPGSGVAAAQVYYRAAEPAG